MEKKTTTTIEDDWNCKNWDHRFEQRKAFVLTIRIYFKLRYRVKKNKNKTKDKATKIWPCRKKRQLVSLLFHYRNAF